MPSSAHLVPFHSAAKGASGARCCRSNRRPWCTRSRTRRRGRSRPPCRRRPYSLVTKAGTSCPMSSMTSAGIARRRAAPERPRRRVLRPPRVHRPPLQRSYRSAVRPDLAGPASKPVRRCLGSRGPARSLRQRCSRLHLRQGSATACWRDTSTLGDTAAPSMVAPRTLFAAVTAANRPASSQVEVVLAGDWGVDRWRESSSVDRGYRVGRRRTPGFLSHHTRGRTPPAAPSPTVAHNLAPRLPGHGGCARTCTVLDFPGSSSGRSSVRSRATRSRHTASRWSRCRA